MAKITTYNFLKFSLCSLVLVWLIGFFPIKFILANENLEFSFSKRFLPHEFEMYIVEGSTENEQIINFYTGRLFKPFWYGNERRIREFKKAVEKSPLHGLPNSKYAFWQNVENKTLYEFELFTMKSFISIIADLNTGLLDPDTIDKAISVYPRKVDHERIFSQLTKLIVSDRSIEEFIYSYVPQDLEYNKLLGELARLRNITINNDWGSPVPEDKFLGYKLDHPNVGKLRSRLFKMGYLTFDNGSTLYDGEIKSAIQLFQADHGLNDDGLAGNYTLQAINISPKTRLIQVLVNLERIRWNDFTETSKYILVNQPNFQA